MTTNEIKERHERVLDRIQRIRASGSNPSLSLLRLEMTLDLMVSESEIKDRILNRKAGICPHCGHKVSR